MRRESHVRFYEGGGVRFPAATRLVPLGEHHLRTVLRQFVEHYHSERNHQGLGNVIPFPIGRHCPARAYLIFPRRRGQDDYAANAATWDRNSNSIGLT